MLKKQGCMNYSNSLKSCLFTIDFVDWSNVLVCFSPHVFSFEKSLLIPKEANYVYFFTVMIRRKFLQILESVVGVYYVFDLGFHVANVLNDY